MNYFVIFVEGTNNNGRIEKFSVPYQGKRIIWEYFMDTITEDYHLINIQVNGWNEINEQEYNKMQI